MSDDKPYTWDNLPECFAHFPEDMPLSFFSRVNPATATAEDLEQGNKYIEEMNKLRISIPLDDADLINDSE